MIKGQPKQDGSGRGIRFNKGRGECSILKDQGQGKKFKEDRFKWMWEAYEY